MHAYSVAPSDHRSDSGPAFSARTRSGARKLGEPVTMPVRVSDASPSTVAMPKSMSTARPSSDSRMLLGLTSRCRMPAAWAARRADSTCRPTLAASRTGSAPVVSTTCSTEGWLTSSITIHGRPPSSTTS